MSALSVRRMKTSVRSLSSRLLTPVALLAPILLGCPTRAPAPRPQVSAYVSYKNNLAVVRTSDSVSIVKFTASGSRGDPVTYEYRQIVRGNGDELAGNGTVLERYITVPTGKNEVTHIANLGQLYVDLGVLSLEWSFQSDTSGYLYYDPTVVTVEVRRATDLEGFDLSKEAEW